jgi:outer membrane protein TolC
VAYWQWSKAVHLAEAMEAAVARSAAQADDTRHLREAGMATENDLLASEVLLDQVRLRRDDALRQIALARTEVERLTGETLPAGARPLGPACPPPPGLTPAGATALALTNRIEIAVLRKEMDAAEATARAARADRRPQVALVARYEQGRPNMRDFPPADKWSGDAYVGAAMSWNLLDGGATAGRLAEAQARVERIRWSLEDTRDHIAAQAQESLLSLQFAVARVQTAAHAETGARKNLDVATDLWKNGLARHSEMLDAQSRLTDAACQRIASAADAVMAEAHLRHATGLLTADDIHGSP